MTGDEESKFTTHHISYLDTGDRWGIPDTPQPVGVLRCMLGTEQSRITLIVDSDHADMLTTAVDYLEGEIEDSPSAIRWMRLGWPRDWETYFEPNAWHRCVDGRAADPRDGAA